MTTWTIDVEAILSVLETDIESAAECLLDTLHELSGVMGPVTYVNFSERTIGLRFDVEAEEARAAGNRGLDLAVTAIEDTHIDGIELRKGTIEPAEAMLHTPDEALATA